MRQSDTEFPEPDGPDSTLSGRWIGMMLIASSALIVVGIMIGLYWSMT